MSLLPGSLIGTYEIQDRIGAGGMGEVYRALDTKLGRLVAIKTLPQAVAQREERLARFEREARLLASLNHPNIAAIYGLDEADDLRFIVLELVPGETLGERLRQGPLALEEARGVFRQIAEALEAAHESGIVHRDLKPENIKITPDGRVKVLDFGLAKAFEEDRLISTLSPLPTITRDALQPGRGEGTPVGILVGTAAYMSPEQTRGKSVDKRTDIWAFGCVLFEALTGRVAFLGETVSDTIAFVLEREPDWEALPASTPPVIRLLLRACLEKVADRRLHDIADARILLEEDMASHAFGAPSAADHPRKSLATPWLIATFMTMLATLSFLGSPWWGQPQPGTVRRTTVLLEDPLRLDTLPVPAIALSPDGSQLVFVSGEGGRRHLYLRPMDRDEATLIPGTEDALVPFFSPDGEWVGFFGEGTLKKISLAGGGPPIEISGSVPPDPRGASWGEDDRIIFSTFHSGILRVSANGGPPEVLATVEPERGEVQIGWPETLPGNQGVLLSVRSGDSWDSGHIELLNPQTGERRPLIQQGYHAHYSHSGHIVFIRNGSLMATPFDPNRREANEQAVSLPESVRVDPLAGFAEFAISNEGTLAYVPDRASRTTLQWVDWGGRAEPIAHDPGLYVNPRVSPDGQRIAIRKFGAQREVWILDLQRGTMTRQTFRGNAASLAWTADGARLTFGNDRSGTYNLYWKAVDGTLEEERLTESEHPQFPDAWSRDGRYLIFNQINPGTGRDIWALFSEGEPRTRPIVATEFDESSAVLSPDGRWLAYQSDESGRYEVFVVPFPNPNKRWQISTLGGSAPLWGPDGHRLYYRNGNRFMRVAVRADADFQAETPELLFEGDFVFGFGSYDIAPDGERLLLLREGMEGALRQIRFVEAWTEELDRLAPPR